MSEFDELLSAARVHLKAGRLAETASVLHLLRALRSSDADGWHRLGHVWAELEGDFQAAACFRMALQLLPGHAGARHELGRLVDSRLRRAEELAAAGDVTAAVLQLGEAGLLWPDDPRPRRALCDRALARAAEGAGLPSRTGEIDAYRFWQLHRELSQGSAALNRGDVEQARTRLGRVAAVATDSEAEMRRIADAARSMIAATAPAVTPPSPEATIAEAERLAAEGRLEEAVGAWRRALPLAEDMIPVRDRLHAAKLALMTPGPRMMPGIGLVDFAIDGGIWRLTPPESRRRVLAISTPTLALADADDPSLDNHGPWETRQIIRTLLAAGCAVDAVSSLAPVLPREVPRYGLVVSLQGGVASVAGRLPPPTPVVVWLTGSNPEYQNRRELERIAAMAARGRSGYAPRRQLDLAAESAAMARADRIVLLGNEHTLSTYPEIIRAKTTRLMPTASRMRVLPPIEPRAAEFLWLGGGGAVLKGLDLTLEAFAGMPELVLHVVGFAADESDFERLYESELYRLPNIRLHGFLRTSGSDFAALASRASVLIAPSASEGASTSVATGLVAGMVCIASADIGIDLLADGHVPLAELSVAAIQAAARHAAAIPPARLAELRRRIRADAEMRFARARFSRDLERLVRDWLEEN